MNEEEEAQELLTKASVRVRDPELVRKYLKRGCCRQETYEALIRVTAETGALIIPFRELPEVKKLLNKEGMKDGS